MPEPFLQPPWLAAAWAELGQHERVGGDTNPHIRSFFADAGHPEVTDDETAWCAAFASACLERAGSPSTRSLAARTYLAWGKPCADPTLGAVAVLSRGSDPALGHVGFLVGWTDDTFALLGGNQSDSVSVAVFPKSRLIGLRWPSAGKSVGPAPTMDAGFDTALAHVLDMEGGYTDDPADPGGPTNFGITLADYARSRGSTVTAAARDGLIDGLKHVSPDVVRAIYLRRYWTPAQCENLPAPIAFFHFDCAVNMGVGTASRMLQNALGVMIDGDVGPLTLSAARTADPMKVLSTYADLRRSRYRSLATFSRFGRGWLARVDRTLQRATTLAAKSPSAKGPPPMLDPAPAIQPAAIPASQKWWGHSLTIWGAVVTGLTAVLPAIAPAFGLDVSPDTVHAAADQVSAILQATVGLAGTLAIIFGRVRATQSLTQRSVTLKL